MDQSSGQRYGKLVPRMLVDQGGRHWLASGFLHIEFLPKYS